MSGPKVFVLVASLMSLCSSAAWPAGAPQQLLNKTIAASYVAQMTLVAPNGRIIPRAVTVQRLIYVSSAGRTFVKFSARGPQGGSRDNEIGPGDRTPAGRAREMRFEGSRLVGTAEIGGGAGRIVITFDPSFTNCSLEVANARSGNDPIVRRGPRGGVFEVQSMTYSGQSCSIREGNAVAN